MDPNLKQGFLKLLKLRLRNFKGVKDFTLHADGQSVTVYGDNGTGKTTIADALSWLLFDKDSKFSSKFEIKTLNEDGSQIHNMEHEVSASFATGNGKTIELRKIYAEKWTRKRGSASPEMTGHETSYYLDGVPCKQMEYKIKAAEIADEEIFKLLTSPLYFPGHLHWQKRREILLAVCGDIPDAKVIDSTPDLADLTAILGDRKMEDHRKVVTARRQAINKELTAIPVRIDEVQRGLPDISGINAGKATDTLTALHADLQKAEAEHAAIQYGGQTGELKKKLSEAEAELQQIRNQHHQEVASVLKGKNSELAALTTAAIRKRGALEEAEKTIARLRLEIAENQKVMESLRADFLAIAGEQFTPKAEKEICAACGQGIPEELQRQAFDGMKATKKAFINEKGKTLKARNDELSANLATMEGEKSALELQLNELAEQEEMLTAEIERIAASKPDDMVAVAAVAAIRKNLDGSQRGDNSEALLRIGAKIDMLGEQIKEESEKVKKAADHAAGQQRINDLTAEEKFLAAEFERLERELFLMDEFSRAKVNLLEEKINSLFTMARFKLFDSQVNGGLSECCEVTYQGVPFNGGLNHGAQINVGLDIISTLSDHYGQRMPVFIDNAEAVTELLPIPDAQVIRLVVSESDKSLRVDSGAIIEGKAA